MERSERDRWLEGAMARWEQSLLRTCFAYLGDLSLAEDAVQETFLKAWKNLDRFRGEASEKTWLLRIAINTCKDVRRSAWFRRVNRAVSLDSLPRSARALCVARPRACARRTLPQTAAARGGIALLVPGAFRQRSGAGAGRVPIDRLQPPEQSAQAPARGIGGVA